MSLDTGSQKADQIAHRFFYKFTIVIDNARNILSEPREDPRSDKWFNLETPDTDAYKDQLKLYKTISQLNVLPPPLDFEVLLTIPELTNNQVLVQHPPNQSRIRVDPTPTHVLLEKWSLSFSTLPTGQSSSSMGEISLATVYKHIMSVIRSLYTLLRFLPTWKICKRLRRRPGGIVRNGHLGIALRAQLRGAEASQSEGMRYLDFGCPLSSDSPALSTSTHSFQPVTHPMDTGPEFTPTLARNPQRESISGSPGGLSMRTSLPRSPPRDRTGLGLNIGTGAPSSIADRFVIPGNAASSSSRTSLPSTSPRARATPLSTGGLIQQSTSGQGTIASVGSIGSSSRLSREEGREVLSSIARVRKESLGTVRGTGELPSTPGSLQLRPFKSNVLSSGPSSLRQASPLTGPTLPSLPAGRTPSSPTSVRMGQFPFRSDTGANSPIGISTPALRAGSSPGTPSRPSPPTHAPSSLGERKFPGSPGESVTGTEPSGMVMPPRRKRYSSSFGYRYAAAGSDGSAGSGEKGKEPDRVGSASYLSNKNTEDDDITAFVQDIEAAKPLGRGSKSGDYVLRHDRERTLSEAGIAGRAVLSGASFPSHLQSETGELSRRTSTPVERIISAARHTRTMSEGPGLRRSPAPILLSDVATQNQIASEVGAGIDGLEERLETGLDSPTAMIMSQTAIDKRIEQLNSRFNETLGLVERRSRIGGTSHSESGDNSMPSSPVTSAGLPFSMARQSKPETGHARSSSLGRYGTRPTTERLHSSPLSRQTQLEPDLAIPSSSSLERRSTSTSAVTHQDPRVENYSIWDNRRARMRADSAASGVSGTSDMSELERIRQFYTQGMAARESGISVSAGGSDEVVGRMEIEQ